jgi:hypothetical protein
MITTLGRTRGTRYTTLVLYALDRTAPQLMGDFVKNGSITALHERGEGLTAFKIKEEIFFGPQFLCARPVSAVYRQLNFWIGAPQRRDGHRGFAEVAISG